MKTQPVLCDERTVAVENASYRLAYLVVSFGLLASIFYRSFVLQQNSWDLFVLVVLAGLTATVYQWAQRVLSRRWLLVTAVTVLVAGLFAFVTVLLQLR